MAYKYNIDILPDKTYNDIILCHTKKNRFLVASTETMTNWYWFVEKYKIDWWAYCEDIEFMLKEWERITDGL